MFEKFKKRLHTVALVREAINNYPDGICFAAPGGRPILSNKMINDVCYMLTGHTVTNADRMWEEIGDLKIPGVHTGPDRKAASDRNEEIEQVLCRLQAVPAPAADIGNRTGHAVRGGGCHRALSLSNAASGEE